MKSKENTYLKVLNIFGIIGTVITILCAIFIMIRKIGLIEELNFGAGAYYYADIPEFEKFINANYYNNQMPMWILVLLFLIWGYLMYHFWIWIDKK